MIASPQRITLNELIEANEIDTAENGIWEEIGLISLRQSLPVYTIPTSELKTLRAISGPETVWEIRSLATPAQIETITWWKGRLRAPTVGLGDVIVVDSSRGESPVTVDGHHRIIAAIENETSLRAVDLADLS